MIQKQKNSILLLATVIFITGCSSISKEECKTGDWNGIGYRDGMSGKPISRVSSYIEECGKAGSTVDRAMYEKGRNEGLKIYCSRENGFNAGKNGSSMFTECPSNLQSAFMKAYNLGKKVHELKGKLDSVRKDQDELEKKMDDPVTTPNERTLIRQRLRDLEEKKDSVNRELTRAELEAEREMSLAPQS